MLNWIARRWDVETGDLLYVDVFTNVRKLNAFIMYHNIQMNASRTKLVIESCIDDEDVDAALRERDDRDMRSKRSELEDSKQQQ